MVVPAASLTKAAVAVAMPLRRWSRFSPTRSPASSPRAGPDTVTSVSPVVKASPSASAGCSSRAGSESNMAAMKVSSPAQMPGSRAMTAAVAVVPAGISTLPVRSPRGLSSSRAASTIFSMARAGTGSSVAGRAVAAMAVALVVAMVVAVSDKGGDP